MFLEYLVEFGTKLLTFICIDFFLRKFIYNKIEDEDKRNVAKFYSLIGFAAMLFFPIKITIYETKNMVLISKIIFSALFALTTFLMIFLNFKNFEYQFVKKFIKELNLSLFYISFLFLFYYFEIFPLKFTFFKTLLCLFSFLSIRIVSFYLKNFLYELIQQIEVKPLKKIIKWAIFCAINSLSFFIIFLIFAIYDFYFLDFLKSMDSQILLKLEKIGIMCLSLPLLINFIDYIIEFWAISNEELLSNRAETLLAIMQILIKFFICAIFIICILIVIGLNPAPIFSSFWIFTAGLSLGLQSIVKDFLTGVFFMFEDAFNIGDMVKIDVGSDFEVSGRVEDITLRVLRVRDFEGGLHTIPFGKVEIVCNKSKDFVFCVVKLLVQNGSNSEKVNEIFKKAFMDFKKLKEIKPYIMEDIEIIGPSLMSANGIIYESRIKMKPGANMRIARGHYYKILSEVIKDSEVNFANDFSLFFKNLT